MAMQSHPSDSFKVELNFWEEFPTYKVHRDFGILWKVNRKNNRLRESSLFMWALAICYDRKSGLFNQPEQDKWEAASDQIFGDEKFMYNLATSEVPNDRITLLKTLHEYIFAFEMSIDTPLGMSLRALERKLGDRTEFIMRTPYTMDYFEVVNKKNVLRKGSADQLDRMFRDTDKITNLIQKALDALKASEGLEGTLKGGGIASLSDSKKDF